MIESIKKHSALVCVSGREEKRLLAIEKELSACKLSTVRDGFGNLIVSKNGLAAVDTAVIVPVDTEGFYVNCIESDGRLRIGAVGEVPKDISSQTLITENGIVGKVSDNAKKIIDCTVDIGAKSNREAEAAVNIGDTLSLYNPVYLSESTLNGAHLSTGVMLALVLDIIKTQGISRRVCVIFATQCSVGMRGARCAGYLADAKRTVLLGAIDAKHAPLGSGVAIVIKDADIISDVLMARAVEDFANEQRIDASVAVTGEASAFQNILSIGRHGTRLLKIALPVDNIRGQNESVNTGDLTECERIVGALLADKIPFERI